MFRTPVPKELAGRTLAEAHLYRRTKCNVVAIENGGVIEANPDPHTPLPVSGELILVGTDTAEATFSSVFPFARRRLFSRRPGRSSP